MLQPRDIGALTRVDPERARKIILSALRKTGVHRGEAAILLGVNVTSLFRWIRKLGIVAEIESMEREAAERGMLRGGYSNGGRNKGSRDRGPRAPRGARLVTPG